MIGIGSDHGGFQTKQIIIEYLESNHIHYHDYGTYNEESTDYPIYALQVGEAVRTKQIEKGILVCTTGIGMEIACNKVKTVRCAKVDNVKEAYLTRFHNDSNVLALSSTHSKEETIEIVKTFLETPFSNEERHQRRIKLIADYEEHHDS